MKLIVAHYHLRPGGVRRVIEESLCAMVAHARLRPASVVFAVGEAPDDAWREGLAARLAHVPVHYTVDSGFGYFSEQRRPVSRLVRAIRKAVNALLETADEESVVWFHNAGLGRNLLFVRELERACAKRGVPFLAHHHDWWFDNRWQRWAEFKRCGVRSLVDVARIIFPSSARCGHAAINTADADVLAQNCSAPVAWLPNPAGATSHVPRRRVRAARDWLTARLKSDAPVWILPCRLLRRKNIAEALLLTRWLRPEARLVTTAGVSSADEVPYFEKLASAAKQHRWPLHLSVMSGDERDKPSVPDLLAASEAVLLTSIQEGFGLPFIEAATSRRPLIARRLPNISPDLDRFGLHFPYLYDDLLIAAELFDLPAERKRQQAVFSAWRRTLPVACRGLVQSSDLGAPVPFSRLTLTAQLEVLAHPPAESLSRSLPLNPFLASWCRQAERGRLRRTGCPPDVERQIGGAAWVERFGGLLEAALKRRSVHDRDHLAQDSFIRQRLDSQNLFPLLLSTRP